MKVEEDLEHSKFLNHIAGLIFCIESGVGDNESYHDFTSVKQGFQVWNNLVKALSDTECFKNGEHCGDCTNEPQSCIRCLIEDYVKKAKQFVVQGTYSGDEQNLIAVEGQSDWRRKQS